MKSFAIFWWIDRWRRSSAFADMTLEEQGAYRNLLDEAALRGGELPADEWKLAKASGDALAWDRVRAAVLAKFRLVGGVYRNDVLDGVLRESRRRRDKQQAYRDRQREGASNNETAKGRQDDEDTGNTGGNAAGNEQGHADGNKAGVPVPSTRTVQLQQERTALPRAARPKASDWKRAIAIGHLAHEKYPDDFTSRAEHFKQACAAQGIDYTFRKDGRPLYARVLDFVAVVRTERARKSGLRASHG